MADPPPQTAFALYDVNINFDDLKTAPESLTLTFPDLNTSTVPLTFFAPRKGYIFRDDETDPPGTPLFRPNPDLENNEFSYSWQGTNDDFDVLLTVNNGQLIGLITGNSKRWGIGKDISSDNYILTDVRLEGYAPNDPDPESLRNYQAPTTDFEDNTWTSHHKEIDLTLENELIRGQNPTVLDMLIVWTEDARIDAGGNPNDPNDTQAIDTLIMTAVDHANLIFSNSLTTTRVSRFHTAKLNGFTVLPGLQGGLDTRENFQDFQSVRNRRNAVGADLVTAVVSDNFYYCGITYVQTKSGCDVLAQGSCGVGAAFDDYAYSIVEHSCAISNDSFTHEVGHKLGGNHVSIEPPNPNNQLPQGWSADVINNGFPEAFAKLQTNVFASIMSVDFDTPRRMYFSNPNVTVNGTPTGNINTQYNAKVIDDLSPAMAMFRDRPDLIFSSGFE